MTEGRNDSMTHSTSRTDKAVSSPTTLGAMEIVQLQEQRADLMMIDVRTPAEFESAHIPGAYNVPLDLLAEHAGEIGSAVGGPVILVCQSGIRAKQAEEYLLRVDLPRLHILEGGVGAWERQGLPLVRGQQRWSLERQVRGIAGGLVLTGALGGLLIRKPIGLLAVAIGGGLTVSAVTNTCTMAMMLSKLPYNRGASCDVRTVMDQIAGHPASHGPASVEQPQNGKGAR